MPHRDVCLPAVLSRPSDPERSQHLSLHEGRAAAPRLRAGDSGGRFRHGGAEPVTRPRPSPKRASRLAGRYETSRRLLGQARSQPVPADPPLRSAQVLFEEARLLRSLGDVPGVEEALRSLLDGMPTGPSLARANALNALVQLQLHQGRNLTELLRTVREAAEAATVAAEPAVAAHLQVTHAALVADDAARPGEAEALLSSAWEVGGALTTSR